MNNNPAKPQAPIPAPSKHYKPTILIILDGMGTPPDFERTPWQDWSAPNFSEIEKVFPFTTLQASGIAVGLPWGEAGNSEVGHLAIGAGKILYNYLPLISSSIASGSFFENNALLQAAERAKMANGVGLHIIGLYSSGTVHAYHEHLHALLDLAKRNSVPNTYLHLFTDGRDAKKRESAEFYGELEKLLASEYPQIKIASVIGRDFAMDRDGNWDRTEKTYNLFVKGSENKFTSARQYINQQYQQGTNDDSVSPAMFESGEGRIKAGDAVVFFNFREDSMRQITKSFAEKDFSRFPRENLNNLLVVTMTEYEKGLPSLAAFKSAEVAQPLAKAVSDAGLKQLHVAETEKYAHITYFLNGGEETAFPGEDRVLIHSPETPCEEDPRMSAEKVADTILEKLGQYDFIAVNFANTDMVGHTGNLEATTEAIRFVDKQIGRIYPKVLEMGGVLAITADHGNAEEKIYKLTGEKRTKHSLNPVPFFLICNDYKREKPLSQEELRREYQTSKGALSDVAPTILDLLGIPKAAGMTGESLLRLFTSLRHTEPVVKPVKKGFFARLFGK